MNLCPQIASERTSRLIKNALGITGQMTRPLLVFIDGMPNNDFYKIDKLPYKIVDNKCVPYVLFEQIVEVMSELNVVTTTFRGQPLTTKGLCFGELLDPLDAYVFLTTSYVNQLNKNHKLIGNYYSRLVFSYLYQKSQKSSQKNVFNVVTSKPLNYSVAEYSAYKAGFIPIAIIDESRDALSETGKFFKALIEVILNTPLKFDIIKLTTTNCNTGANCTTQKNINGAVNHSYVTYWASRKRCMEFLQLNQPFISQKTITTIKPAEVLFHILLLTGYLEHEALSVQIKQMLSTVNLRYKFDMSDEFNPALSLGGM